MRIGWSWPDPSGGCSLGQGTRLSPVPSAALSGSCVKQHVSRATAPRGMMPRSLGWERRRVAMAEESSLIRELAVTSHEFDGTGADAERNCWMAVHRHEHGVLPSEYDIREVPEELYLAVLAERRRLMANGGSEPAGSDA